MITSIKLEEKQIEIDGKTYTLHVNMSVLDRIQQTNGGEISALLKRSPNDVMAVTMAEMLNDWAEDQGWDEEWTEKKVKKFFTVGMLNMLDVFGMFNRALTPIERPDKLREAIKEPETDEESGN